MNYKKALIVYFCLFCGLISPYLILGEVIAPHRKYLELVATEVLGNHLKEHIENRKFSDNTNGYIPEISMLLNGPRSGWLALWTNKNELGRPLYQISGFSPAYFASWLISLLTNNPWHFITVLSLLNCFFAGFFIILFCREIHLHSFAGLIAGVSLATSPLFMYWLTFPMFPAVWCWSAGALWAVTRLAKRPDLIGWSILAFSSYSLLMTGYPQVIIFHAYILSTYGIYLIYCKRQLGGHAIGRFLLFSITALLVGVALAIPVYLDLAHLSAESARVAPDSSFFTCILPRFGKLTDNLRFFVLSTMPELFGNPISSNFPFSYDGLSITPIVIFFSIIGLLISYRKIWGWWLAIMVLFLFAFVHPLYVLGIKYLGFNLSRSTPLGSIGLPLTVIVAYGVDALVKRTAPKRTSWVVGFATVSVLATISVGLGFGFAHAVSIQWSTVVAMLILVVLFAAQYYKTYPVLLIMALIIVLATISYPLMLRQNPTQIAITSPLVEKIRTNLPPDSCFAVAAPGLSVLPPNLNAELGLSSIHSYNSLSSHRYHAIIKDLGGEMQTYGRWNGAISPDYNSAMFWMSNISLILSPKKITHENLEYLGNESGIHLQKVISRMGQSLQVALSETKTVPDGLDIVDPRLLMRHTPIKLVSQGDLLEFEVTPEVPSVLILNQKFHRDWHAQAFNQSGWVVAKTTVINGVFQGVFLPENTQRVRLEFKPFARYSWIGHVFWLSLLVLIIPLSWKQRNPGPAKQ